MNGQVAGTRVGGTCGQPSHSNGILKPVFRTVAHSRGPPRGMRLRIEELAVANRRKDEFLAMVGHELRSPLGAIRNAIAVLGNPAVEPSSRHRAQALAERQVHRMTAVIDDLLDSSRILQERLFLQCERIDLRIVVRYAIEVLEYDINERKHRLDIKFPHDPVWLQGDAGRLEQVFINLIANASKYTDAGGELAVWMHTRPGKAVVRVRDSGIGIVSDVIPHIFELFRQANATDPRSKSGLGIGLALVRQLVELHGGRVSVASAGRGTGSEFTVCLCTED
jgi:two-component system, sensor histidine kinase